jgi:hypothetical protein
MDLSKASLFSMLAAVVGPLIPLDVRAQDRPDGGYLVVLAKMAPEPLSIPPITASDNAAIVSSPEQTSASIRVVFRNTSLFARRWVIVDALSGQVVVDQRLAPGGTAQARIQTRSFGDTGQVYFRHDERTEWTYRPSISDGDVVDLY